MKVLTIVKYVFALVGLGMLIGAFFLYSNTASFLEKALKANGTVVDLAVSRSSDSRTYAPVVQFTDQQGNQVEFVSSTSSSPPSYAKGETVEVLYLPANPQDAEINGFFSLWFGLLILGGLGVIFFAIGGGIILYFWLDKRKDKYLREQGIAIQADFQEVIINRSIKANGQSPYQIVAQWQNPSTSKVHVFKSDNIWFDPSEFIDRRKIRVFIEKDNPEKYDIDLSFLPELS